MAESLLECYRLDRYEFQVYVSHLESAERHDTTCPEGNAVVDDDAQKSERDDGEETAVQKYTVRTAMGSVLLTDVCNYDDGTCDERADDRCFAGRDDVPKPKGVDKLAERYAVDEKPVCTARSVCYKFTDRGYISQNAKTVTINKGVTCIFACVPRTLIQFIQMNPLELTVYGDQDQDQDRDRDRDRGRIEFGEASVTLSGPTGFTDAIAHHFYESGRHPYSHAVDRTLDLTVGGDDNNTVVVGTVSVRVTLTCHGPETRRGVVPVTTMPDRPPLRPAFVDPSDVRYGRPVVQPPPRMMYDDAALGQSVVRKPGRRTAARRPRDPAEYSCLCDELLTNVNRVLFDGQRDHGSGRPREHHRRRPPARNDDDDDDDDGSW